jgi:hypothetical protein
MPSFGVVFPCDVDDTLLDNDRVTEDLQRDLEREVGRECQERYWTTFEQLWGELGYADYLGALQRYRPGRLHEGLMQANGLIEGVIRRGEKL